MPWRLLAIDRRSLAGRAAVEAGPVHIVTVDR
jgi:hypothetical protein